VRAFVLAARLAAAELESPLSYISAVRMLTTPDRRFSRVEKYPRKHRMKPPRKPTTERQQPASDRAADRKEGEDLQPPATGSNGGSPAAPVMKQFAKTKAESSGRS